MMAGIRVAALGLLLAFLGLESASAGGAAFLTQGPRRPFPLLDLERRASGLVRAAENLITLVEGHREGRLDDAELKSYLRERAGLLKDLAGDIQSDRSVRQIDWMKRGSRKLSMPEKPRSLGEAVPLMELAVKDAKSLLRQVRDIARDSDVPEVSVEELARPSPAALCRRVRKTAEILEDFAKSL